MRKQVLFALSLAISAPAGAADLCGIRAADIRSGFTGEIPAPAPVIVRTFPAASATDVCETAIARMIDFRKVSFKDAKGRQLRGFDDVYFTEYGPMAVSLVMQTETNAYYYYNDCDICAEIDRCDLKTGEVRRLVAAHWADCGDLPKNPAGLVYTACAGYNPGQTCAAVGEDVRIPSECCSGTAEPNQNGEMTCVPAPHVEPHCAKDGEDVRTPYECCSGNAVPNGTGEMTCVAAPVPSCAGVGDDVRIPSECCSGAAEPNQNGEMTCIGARTALR